jgi:UDP-glucose 4-epimerase
VQKAPACTIETLAKAVVKLYGVNVPVNVIGTRHGEKVYETLVTREEMTRAEDLGRYYRVAADIRDLNYDKYLDKGDHKITTAEEFHSHNTRQLNVDEMIELLKTVKYIREDMGMEPIQSGVLREEY